MRWTDTITLLSWDMWQDDMHVWHQSEEPTKSLVFCNQRTLSAQRRTEYVDLGMRPEAQVEVRTCDYGGQTKALYHDTEYDVEPSTSGDFTYLTLGRLVEDA